MTSAKLVELTEWIRDNPYPVFSLLISRNGALVYELYTAGIEPDAAHYVASVTKTVVATLVGVALDQGRLSSTEATLSELLEIDRHSPAASLTLRELMGMRGFDAPDPPRAHRPLDMERWKRFWIATNRLAVALEAPRLESGFQYNDYNPVPVAAVLQRATGTSLLRFAESHLFEPLGFQNYEWLHRDASGLENGGYGLRLRPIDMHRLGLLYLTRGKWHGKQVISESWVDRSFKAWNYSETKQHPNDGWFWWTLHYAPGWTARIAKGWKGQRIAVIPEQKIVITMTGCISPGSAPSEEHFFERVVLGIVKPSVEAWNDERAAAASDTLVLRETLAQVKEGAPRFGDFIQHRMVPSVAPKRTGYQYGL